MRRRGGSSASGILAAKGWAVLAAALAGALLLGTLELSRCIPPVTEPDVGETAGPEEFAPIRFLIGRWGGPSVIDDPRMESRPGLSDEVLVSLEWGARQRVIRLFERHGSARRHEGVLEGLVVWHPLEDELRFIAVNTRERLLLEGAYRPLSEGRLERVYDVYYPESFAHIPQPEIEGRVRRFREIYIPLDRDRLRVTLDIWRRSRWERWPATAGEYLLVRLS